MLTKKETKKLLVEWKDFLKEAVDYKKIAVVDLDGTVFEKGISLINLPEGTSAGPIKYFALSSVESLTVGAKSKNNIFNGDDEVFTQTINQINSLKKEGCKVVLLTGRSVPNFQEYRSKKDPNLNFVESSVTLIENNGELLNKIGELVRAIGLQVDEIYPLNMPEEGKKNAKKPESYKKDAIVKIASGASEVIIFEDDREIKVALQNKLHKEQPEVLVNFAEVGPSITDKARAEEKEVAENIKNEADKIIQDIFGEGSYKRASGRPSDSLVKMRDSLYPSKISSEEDDVLQSVIKVYAGAEKKIVFKDYENIVSLKKNTKLLSKIKEAYSEATKEQGFTPEIPLKENKYRLMLKKR